MDAAAEKQIRKIRHRTLQMQASLALAIQEAHREGASLREIAKAAEMSHEQVRRIVSRA